MSFRAVVFGATGATGRELVSELAHSDACSCVNAVTRREIKSDELPSVFPNIVAGSAEAKKIKVHPVDYERLKETAGDSCKADVAFCCLGTTQSEAGGRAGFTKVDLGYVAAAASVAREAGTVGHFALVTAQGVNRRYESGRPIPTRPAAHLRLMISLWTPIGGVFDRPTDSRLTDWVLFPISKTVDVTTVDRPRPAAALG